MNLIEDAKTVLLKAWSVRLALASATLSAAEVALPYFAPFMPPNVMAIAAALTSAAAVIARVIAQPKMREGAKETP